MAENQEQTTGPIATEELIGHVGAERAFLETAATGRMPHAWLISGPLGIGKMTLAYRMARFRLTQQDGDDLFSPSETLHMDGGNPIFHRVMAGGHGDLRTIEREVNYRTKKRRSDIVVDQIRDLSRFFTMTSAEGGWRVAIIDGADEMNPNAANALLKLLEEPPARSLLLLVCHAPGRLLPTIRSRCRHLILRPLNEADAMAVMMKQAPDLDQKDRLGLVRLAEGSPGRALAMAKEGGLEAYGELLAMVRNLPDVDFAAVHALGDKLNRANNEEAYRVWVDLFRLWVSRLARGSAARGSWTEATLGEEDLARRLTNNISLDHWVGLWEKIGSLAMRAEQVNLDRKQVVINAFMALQSTARQ